MIRRGGPPVAAPRRDTFKKNRKIERPFQIYLSLVIGHLSFLIAKHGIPPTAVGGYFNSLLLLEMRGNLNPIHGSGWMLQILSTQQPRL